MARMTVQNELTDLVGVRWALRMMPDVYWTRGTENAAIRRILQFTRKEQIAVVVDSNGR